MDIYSVIDTFNYLGMHYSRLEIGGGSSILVTEHGGHIFGPFSEEYPEGLFWSPKELCDKESFGRLIRDRVWNIGGDRVWIAPEIQFNIGDRNHYRETLDTPKTIDPGSYIMEKGEDSIRLAMALDLQSHNTVEGQIHLCISRMIHRAENPLRKLPDYDSIMETLVYSGYEEVIDLEAASEEQIYAETWNLLQIRPEGTLFIPMYSPVRGTDHYEPAGDFESAADNGILLRITGTRRYKIAYKSAVTTGRMGYLMNPDKNGCSALIIVCFPNNPSAMYSEEPPLIKGETGYSIHIYNDDGTAGFAEMECNMPTIGRPAGIGRSTDRISKWIFTGRMDSLEKAAKILLGWRQ